MAMSCNDFLELYSDYRDHRITDERVRCRIRQHLRDCSRCMGYDALVSRGVIALRGTSEIRPSSRFRRELRRRLGESEIVLEPAVRSAPAGVMAGLMVAGILLLVGWAGASLFEQPEAPGGLAVADPPPATSDVAATPAMPAVNLEPRFPAFGTQPSPPPPAALTFGHWVSLTR